MKIDLTKAELSYFASITFQNFRRSLLLRKKEDVTPSWHTLYVRLERDLKGMIENSPTFKVNLVKVVEIIKETESFRIMNDYENHIKTT
jgi:hypothetical protein